METVASGSILFMPTSVWGKRAVPIALGGGMLATVVAAVLSPNIGAVPVPATCAYGTCPAGTSTPFPWWIVGVIAVIVIALIAAYLVFGRRRPPSQGSGPAAWEPPAGAAAGGVAAGAASAPSGPAPSGEAGTPPSYLETDEDIGAGLPAVAGGAAVGVAAGAAAGTAAAEEEPDIDSLMAELDKISGEILKKAPKKGAPGADVVDTPPGK
jgi:hypothetical protein